MILTTDWQMVFIDRGFRYVNHKEKLLTTGFGKEEGLKRNTDIISTRPSALTLMRERYQRVYEPYQPKTGQPCSCKKGIERDNCPQCEGTGQRIDFAAIRNRNNHVSS